VGDWTMLFNIITNFHVFEINLRPMERKKRKNPFDIVTFDGTIFFNAWFDLKSFYWNESIFKFLKKFLENGLIVNICFHFQVLVFT
jgi:hypothetical protein